MNELSAFSTEIIELSTQDLNTLVDQLHLNRDINKLIACYKLLAKREPKNITYRYSVAHFVNIREGTPEHNNRMECNEILLKILADFPVIATPPYNKKYSLIYMRLGENHLFLGNRSEGFKYLNTAAELNNDADLYYNIAEYYFNDGNHTEYLINLLRAISLNPKKYRTLANIDSAVAIMKQENTVINGENIPSKQKYHRWPSLELFRGDLSNLIKSELTNVNKAEKFLSEKSSFFTMGSCFAENISLALRDRGYKSTHMPLSETINTTFANKYLIDYLNNTSRNTVFNKRIEETLPSDWNKDLIISRIRESDILIITMGVATGFFDNETKQMIMPRPKEIHEYLLDPNKFESRMTTVSENVENMSHVIKFIKSLNPIIKIILTVSPIPISTSFESESAILTDCVSKSTMRVAAYELSKKSKFSDVYYWPSFEVFRWIASLNSDYWAEDDGSSMHVSSSRVKVVIDSFIDHFSE